MTVAVRHAHLTDIPWILDELKDFARFYETKRSLYGDEAYVTEKLTELITHHVALVAETDLLDEGTGKVWPVGFVGGVRIPQFMNPEIQVLAEMFWWVCPHHRNGRAALMLLNAFIEIGQTDPNIHWITFSTIEGRTPVKPEAFLKRGFKLFERAYLIEKEVG